MVSSFLGASFACSCRAGKVLQGRSFIWGPLAISLETTTQGHLSGCPAAQVTGMERNQKVGLRYTGLKWFLDSAVQFSFAMKSGAGGWSISPNFTYHPTVDSKTAPAFRILTLLMEPQNRVSRDAEIALSTHRARWQMFSALALAKLIKLFRTGKASPLAVNSRNENLIHHMMSSVSHSQQDVWLC